MVKVLSFFFLHVTEHQQRAYKSIKVKTFKTTLFRSILTHTSHTSFKPWKHGEQHLEGCYEKFEKAKMLWKVWKRRRVCPRQPFGSLPPLQKGAASLNEHIAQFKFAGKFAPCRMGWRIPVVSVAFYRGGVATATFSHEGKEQACEFH